MRSKKRILAVIVFISSIIVIGGFSRLYSSNDSNDIYYNVIKYINIFGQVYKEVANSYVEEIDPEKFIKAGIQGMLDELDPYTVFLEEEGKDELEIMTRGKYYGVGMRISLRNGWPTVAEQPFPNFPAAKAGIREGDQIIEIDGQSTKGGDITRTASKLRGERNTEVKLKIIRVGIEDPIELTLIRDEIEVSEIDFAGMVEPGIGLIRLARFNRGSGKELYNEIVKLQDQGMEALIFDLRGNPGGLLDVSVSVLENFVPKGDLVVYTRGRDAANRQDFHTRKDPIYGDKPLVVLVDGFSASASEIVTGAIQDLDRGVIIGTETFGKGLVQTVVDVDRKGETKLKITTAQYFLPSGRLIQRSDVFNKGQGSVFMDADENEDLDAAKGKKDKKKDAQFQTKNGRVVLGGGGIKPDVEIENEKTTKYVAELRRNSMFFNFSLNYAVDHHDISPGFDVTDTMVDDFFKFTREKQFDYAPDGYKEMEEVEKIAQDEGYYTQMKPHFDALRKEFDGVKVMEKEKSMRDIKFLIKRELTAKVFGNDEAYKASFERDDVLKKAVETLKNRDEYNKILNITVASQN